MIATVFPQAANDEIHCIENDEINVWKPIAIAKVDEFEICKYLLDAPVFGESAGSAIPIEHPDKHRKL